MRAAGIEMQKQIIRTKRVIYQKVAFA
jgi:hypothetical protein